MPELSAQATRLRAGAYSYTGSIGTIPETVAMSRAVNQAVFTYPVTSLTFDDAYAGAGAFGDVKVDQDIIVYDQNTNTVKGHLRVAFGGATSTVIQINEVAQGVISFANNDRFEVIEVWRIWDKLVSATAAFNKDSRDTYGDEGSNPPPISNPGGAWFGLVDPGQSYATVQFNGVNSWFVDPDSSAVTYGWNVGDGTITVGSVSTSAITATFPVGFRHVALSVTDNVNGKITTKYVPVRVYNSANPPMRVLLERLHGDAERGWSATFRLPLEDENHLNNLPDGAFICYFEDELYGNVSASYGSNVANRSHIKFIGFLVRESISIDAETDEVVFEAVSPLQILELTPALPQLMIYDNTPSRWSEVKTLTVGRALWYLAFWHSAFPFDFLQWDGDDFAFARLAVDNIDSIAGQLRDIASSINTLVTCDALGRLLFVRDPHYMDATDRDAVDTTYDLNTDDLLSIEITREHRYNVKTVRGEGLRASTTVAGTKALFSNAPGNAPAPNATGADTLAKQIVASQTDLNERTGHHWARLNSTYNGLPVPKGVRITLADGYAVFDPAYREWVTLTLPAETNRRGIEYTASQRWTVEQVDITYDPEAGTKEVTLTLDAETFGVSGTTYIPPQSGESGLPSVPSLDLSFPEFGYDFGLPTPNMLIPGVKNIALIAADGQAHYSTNFEVGEAAGGPSYASDDLTARANWNGASIQGFAQDAFATANGIIDTDTHKLKINNIGLTPTLAVIGAFRGTSERRSMNSERAEQGFCPTISWYGADGVWAEWTDDNTTLETPVQINANYDTGLTPFWFPGIAVNPNDPGEVTTTAFTNTTNGVGLTAQGYRSEDHCATWSIMSSTPILEPNQGLAGAIAIPYGNVAGSTFFHARTNDAGLTSRLIRVVGGTTTDITPSYGGNDYGPVGRLRAIAVSDSDPNFVVACCFTTGVLSTVFYTQNALAATPTWTPFFEPVSGFLYLQAYIASPEIYLIGFGAIAIARVGLSIVDSRIGNLSIGSTEIVGLCGWTP